MPNELIPIKEMSEKIDATVDNSYKELGIEYDEEKAKMFKGIFKAWLLGEPLK